MNRDEFQKFYEALGSPQQGVIALLLGLKQPAVNTYLKGTRTIPAYVGNEVEFFQKMNKREQKKALRQAVEIYEASRDAL